MIDASGDDISDIIGQSFMTDDNVVFVPDILSNGEYKYLPVFTSAEQMGEYGESFTPFKMTFIEAMERAENCPDQLSGIVIDAFTEPFELPKQFFSIVKEIKTSTDGK